MERQGIHVRKLHALALGGIAVGAAAAVAAAAPLNIGPSTTLAPYVLPKAPGVSTTSILTAGDVPTGNGYRMVGIPDGLGAYKGKNAEGRNSVVVLMNHEIGTDASNNPLGTVRGHGEKGAFVARLVIDSKTLEVKSGSDLIKPGVRYYNYATGAYGPAATGKGPFGRFCSGSLTEQGQLFKKGVGTKEQIYFANEETGNEGRLFGVLTTGEAQQLPRLGLFSWENTLAAENRGVTTLVHGDEDGALGELWVYVGGKTNAGNEFDKAGLTNGESHVLKIPNAITTDAQFRAAYNKGDKVRFSLAEVDWNATGAVQNAQARTVGGLAFNRMEDGAWDPRNRNVFYFLTTEGGEGTSGNAGKGGGLWRVTYDDIENPEAGGTLELLLDGTEPLGLNKPDNMGIDKRGNIMIQEDPGAQNPPTAGESVNLSRIVAYRISDGAMGVVAQFNPTLFQPATGRTIITQDEESSGIIPTDDLFGRRTWLFDAQVHAASLDPELVESGQLLLLKVKDYDEIYGNGNEDDGVDEG
jgi:hypothetical protein